MEHLYYLVAQLPAFSVNSDSNSKLPITTEYFKDLCSRFMSSGAAKAAKSLSLEPPKKGEPTGSAFLDQWYTKERNLRFALAQVRALKMKKEAKDIPISSDGEVVQAARTATVLLAPNSILTSTVLAFWIKLHHWIFFLLMRFTAMDLSSCLLNV